MDVHVIDADWRSHEQTLLDLRKAVHSQDPQTDVEDAVSCHLLAINAAGQRLGCLRLTPDGRLDRLAVRADTSTASLTGKLLEAARARALELGLAQLSAVVDADHLLAFTAAGFLADAVRQSPAGRIRVSLPLPIPYVGDSTLPKPIVRPAAVPEAAGRAKLVGHHGERECQLGVLDALRWPHRILRIVSPNLDHLLFDRIEVADAVSAFVRSAPAATLRILIHSSSLIVSRGHRLVELARRLDSKIEIRTVPEELAGDRHATILADEHGYFLMPDYQDYQALSNPWDPAQAEKLIDRFDYLWERSHPDPELRILRL